MPVSHGNTLSCALLVTYFQNFAADSAIGLTLLLSMPTELSEVVSVSTSRALTSLIRRGPDSTCTVFFTQVSPSSDHLICVLVTAGWAMEVAFSYVFAFKSFFSVPFGSSFFAGGSAGFFSLCSSFVAVFFIS